MYLSDHSKNLISAEEKVAELIKQREQLRNELAAERARLDWLMAGGVCMMQAPGGFYISRLHAHVSRAAIDASMKEETK
jgi:hypothetical protein